MNHVKTGTTSLPTVGSRKKLRVLILEDVSRDADLVARELRRVVASFESRHAATREMFLEALDVFRPDLVLSDYTMPGFNGIEALQLVKERAPSTPVIIVTGSISEEVAAECIKAGADDYVLKENLKRLGPAVHQAMERARLRQENAAAERELEQAAREWRITFDAMSDAVCVVDAEGRLLRCNEAMSRLFNRPLSEILGRHCFEVVHGTCAPVANCPFECARHTKRRETMEFQAKDRWIQVTVDPLLDKEGSFCGAVHVMTDLTDRKRTEGTLLLHDRRMNALLELNRRSSASPQELVNFAVEAAAVSLDSPCAFVGTLSPDERTLTYHAWSKDFMDRCAGPSNSMVFPSVEIGPWAEAVRERKPVVVNDCTTHPHFKRVDQEGNVTFTRQLCVPVLEGMRIVAVGAVANKATDYTETDAAALEALVGEMWHLLRHMQEEAALERSEANLDAAQRLARMGSWDYDFRTNAHWCSKEMSAICEMAPADGMDTLESLLSLIHPEDQVQARADIEWARQNRTDCALDCRLCLPSGREKVVHVRAQTLSADDGSPLRFMGIVQDITAARQIERERTRLALAIEHAAEAVVITDLQGVIQYVNPAFEQFTGYSAWEVVGQNPRILKSGEQDDAFYRSLWDAISTRGLWKGRFVNRRKDGSLYTEDATISAVRDPSGRIINYVAVKRDITEELRKEERLLQAQKMEAIGQLAGGVAHDFNNILQAIIGYVAMLQDRVEEESPLHEFACEIGDAAERASGLTRQLLAFSRRQVLQAEDVDLNDVVRDLMKMIKRVIGEDIKIHVTEGSELASIHADRGQIEQILLNLCVNARDAMPEGGTLEVETKNVILDDEYCSRHNCANPGCHVLLSVTDTGCGMDKATLERIFEPFFTTKELGRGTGLGLATVYGIVRQHNGIIEVYSERGQGSTFKVYLPSVDREASFVEDKDEANPEVGGTETILLAEDDPALQRLAQRILEAAGYSVLIANNGEEALEVFEAHKEHVDLALLDVVMPKASGLATYEILKVRKPGLRFLFSSGYSTSTVHVEFLLSKGIEFLQKPYSPKVLLQKIRLVLDAHLSDPEGEQNSEKETTP
ncbi:MAG: PAS domain S-box protein [Candidatus Hydrogenedentes bacterium]|nr:PAS domain S-box protein [Candidatus Hydrogenedentota bacterium]